MSRSPSLLYAHCRSILEAGSVEDKLASLPGPIDALIDDSVGDPTCTIDAPVRSDEISFARGSSRLPKPARLANAEARVLCLARFAHHELMAVELFAWALLRWPELPRSLRGEWLRVMLDEQRHCRLYLERLGAHGAKLSDHPQAPYFWRHVPEILASANPPLAFLAGMGLTLEQANLDFTLTYAEAFRRAGDEQSARVCERVHADEIRHVEVSARWLRELAGEVADDGDSEIERYESNVPAPLGAARAKGRRFDRASREGAGLTDAFIEHVRSARSPQEVRGTIRKKSSPAKPGAPQSPEIPAKPTEPPDGRQARDPVGA